MIGTTDDPQANRKHADDFSIKQDNTNTKVFVPAATQLSRINIVTDTPALATNPTSKSLSGRESHTHGTKLATAGTIRVVLGRGISLTSDFTSIYLSALTRCIPAPPLKHTFIKPRIMDSDEVLPTTKPETAERNQATTNFRDNSSLLFRPRGRTDGSCFVPKRKVNGGDGVTL